MPKFDGLSVNMNNLHLLSDARSRSISAENFSGEKGRAGMATEGTGQSSARDLGQGWKVSPSVRIKPGETLTLADIRGPGAIQHIWITAIHPRFTILRFYWDDQETPSIEVPAGDFFCAGWGLFAQVASLPVCVNPGSGWNCYWIMPFRKRCRITLENLKEQEQTCYFQIDYALAPVAADAAYLHAQFRRANPLPYKEVYTILDGVKGKGHYVGAYLAWGVNNTGWWGEGEIKFYLDGDKTFPTICGTGTEDYFCGSYNFDPGTANQCTYGNPMGEAKRYQTYTTPYAGMHQVIRPDGVYQSQTRFGMYRWHIADPVRFEKDLKVTIQALGWRDGGRYLPRQDDIASVAYWYQTLPAAPFPKIPGKDALEVV